MHIYVFGRDRDHRIMILRNYTTPSINRVLCCCSSSSIRSSLHSKSRSFSSTETTNATNHTNLLLLQPNHRTHLIFGANTDVGKTIITTGFIRASLLRHINNHHHHPHPHIVHYIKPLQCGSLKTGGDQGFVERYVTNILQKNSNHHSTTPTTTTTPKFTAQTLFQWSTPASPHVACSLEQSPVSDVEVLHKLHTTLSSSWQIPPTSTSTSTTSTTATTTYIETAGGVLSPSSSSPHNHHPQRHVMTPPTSQNKNANQDQCHHHENIPPWGWTLQGDLYRQSSVLMSRSTWVILIGDGRLGGISTTISALESLLLRGYDIAAIVFLEPSISDHSNNNNNIQQAQQHHIEGTNVQAIRDYVSSRQLRSGNGELLFPFPKQSIVSLPSIPNDPNIPLYEWYESPMVTSIFQNMEHYISNSWEDFIYDLRSTIHTVHNKNDSSNANPIWIPGSTDQSCRRLFVHNSNCGNDDTSTSSALQIIQSSSIQCTTNDMNDNNTNGPSSPFLSSIPAGATSTTTSNNNTDVLECKSILDASGSWWTQSGVLNENYNTSMILAMAATASRYGGHVSGTPPASCMIHNPLLLLSQTLQRYHKKWATHVYYTDDGGTSAIEVAIKMGFKTYQQRMNLSQNEIEQTHWIMAAQEGCYHGDSLGAMNIMESYVSTEHPWYQERSFCLATPTIGYQQGVLSITLPDGMTTSDDVAYIFESIHDVMDIHVRSLSPKLLSLYKEMIEMQWLAYEHRTQQKIGSVILEPLLQCASGMKFVDPLWQAAMMDVAQSRNIPVILDESTVGMYRLGIRSCAQILLRDPDIVIYSKLLTGGIIPLSAVVTNKSVYDACVDVEFLYGNTSVASPVACASALYTLSMYDAYHKQQAHDNSSSIKYSSQPYLLFDEERVKQISLLSSVKQCFTLGSVLTITLNPSSNNDNDSSDIAPRLVQKLLDRENLLVGLNQVNHNGDVVYIMVAPFAEKDECNRITDILCNTIQEL